MSNLLNCNFHGLDTLIAPHRYLILDGPLLTNFNGIECTWILVFNDIIAFAAEEGKADKGKNPKRHVQGYLDYNTCWLQPFIEIHDAFEIITPETKILLRAGTVTKSAKINDVKKGNSLSVSSTTISTTSLLAIKPKNLLSTNTLTSKTPQITNLTALCNTLWVDIIQERIRNSLVGSGLWKDQEEAAKNREITQNISCTQRYAQYKFKDGSIYIGYWLNGKFNGKGRLESANGTILEGNYERGALYGYGKATYSNAIYVGEWQQDCPHGQGTLKYNNGTVYSGSWIMGRRKGNGTLKWVNGDSYVGMWNDDRMDGKGILSRKEPPYSYDGGFKENAKHGMGTLCLRDYTYIGEWANDLPHGRGQEITKTGTYKGMFKAGKKEDEGVWQSEDGNITYTGEWKNNKYHGTGKYFNKLRKYTYDGEWEEGKKSGKGKEIHGDKSTYNGRWENDLYEGKGTWKSALGETYNGHWHQGVKYGTGKFTYTNLDEYTGEWYRDRKEGYGTFTWIDGSWYRGYWANDLPHGEGEWHYSSDTLYNGQFLNGLRHGTGILTTPKGVYTGIWESGKRQGKGVMQYNNGVSFEGMWEGDQKIGVFKEKSVREQSWKEEVPGIKFSPPDLPDPPVLDWEIVQ